MWKDRNYCYNLSPLSINKLCKLISQIQVSQPDLPTKFNEKNERKQNLSQNFARVKLLQKLRSKVSVIT